MTFIIGCRGFPLLRRDVENHHDCRMTRIVAELFTSLNGVVKPRQNWHGPYCDDTMRMRSEELLLASELMLLSRVTYHEYAGFWPTATGRMAELMNEIPKLVVSSTLGTPHWHNTAVLRGALADHLGAVRAQSCGDIVVAGSVQVVKDLIRLRQLDELRLITEPTVLADGARIFDGVDRRELTFVDAHPFPTGAVALTYAFARDVPNLSTRRSAA
jgi:dihydrofolate reductase